MNGSSTLVATGMGRGADVLVTGASGFVGSALLRRAVSLPGWRLRAAVRRRLPTLSASIEQVLVGDLSADTDWSGAVAGIDVVVHAAARVHVLRETAADALSEFRRANVDGALTLARGAAAAGVRRFVFVSSIKVNGERTAPGRPFRADDVPAPEDPYGLSKLEAEEGLREIAADSGMELVIIRPSLVYGPGVKANFLALMQWVNRGVPLPLATVRNKRSFVALDNLVDLILTCVRHQAAAGEVFLAADGEDLSTTELLQRVGFAMNRPVRLFSLPTAPLQGVASLLGRRDFSRRLFESLQVDSSKARDILGWTPPISVDEGLRRVARHFLSAAAR
jgi:nucleoside-diphosphate-sugar epimerase